METPVQLMELICIKENRMYCNLNDKKKGRSANSSYTQAGVLCFVGQESDK